MKRNCYVDSYVAYLDILGFKDFIKNNSDFDKAKELYDTITKIYEGIIDFNFKSIEPDDIESVTFNIISDSIILSIPKHKNHSLEILIAFIITLVINVMFKHGMIFRGVFLKVNIIQMTNLHLVQHW